MKQQEKPSGKSILTVLLRVNPYCCTWRGKDVGFQPLMKSCSLNLLCGINTASKAARKLSTLTSIPLLFYFALPSILCSLTSL